jgi:hypothetical protein
MLPDQSWRDGTTSVAARLGLLCLLVAGCSGGDSTDPGPSPPDPQPPDEGSVILQWTRPETNEDGSALTDLAGYKVYYGKSESALELTIDVHDPTGSRIEIQQLDPGTWHFAITAYNQAGLESRKSAPVSTIVRS